MDANTSMGSGIARQPSEGLPIEAMRLIPPSLTLDQSRHKPLRSFTDKSASQSGINFERWLKVCHWSGLVAWGICTLAAFAFIVIASTPVLLPLLTFGNCFSGGWHEWVEFTRQALRMSLPAGIGAAMAGGLAYGLGRARTELKRRAALSRQGGSDLRMIEGLIQSERR